MAERGLSQKGEETRPSCRAVQLSFGDMASLATTIAVVVAIVFGLVQARIARRQRADALVQDAIHMAQSEHVVEAIREVLELPGTLTFTTFEALPNSSKYAVFRAGYALDSLGWMVYRRMIAFHDVDQIMGGAVRGLWKKLRPMMDEQRIKEGNPCSLEWLQWMAEQMDKDPAPGKAIGAHIAFKEWARDG